MAENLEKWIEELLKLDDAEDRMTDKQIKILKAAIEIFSEKGYAATSTSEIAQKAGVAEGTIFRHYKTKKDLLISIVAPLITKIITPIALKDFNKVLGASYPQYEDFLRAIIHNRLQFAKKNLHLIKILIQEIPFHPELQAQFKEHVAKKVLERFEKVVVYFQEKGDLRSIPTYTVIRFTISAAMGFIISRVLLVPELEWDDEKETELSIDLIMHGLSAKSSSQG